MFLFMRIDGQPDWSWALLLLRWGILPPTWSVHNQCWAGPGCACVHPKGAMGRFFWDSQSDPASAIPSEKLRHLCFWQTPTSISVLVTVTPVTTENSHVRLSGWILSKSFSMRVSLAASLVRLLRPSLIPVACLHESGRPGPLCEAFWIVILLVDCMGCSVPWTGLGWCVPDLQVWLPTW